MTPNQVEIRQIPLILTQKSPISPLFRHFLSLSLLF